MPLPFLDYLECEEIKQAFLRGQMAFILSSDCRNILWSNGFEAYFFGFSSLAAMIQERSFFDQVEHDKILKCAQWAGSVALGSLKRCAEFSVISIDVLGLGKAFFLEASREEAISLIACLDDAKISVAVIDENATRLEASSHFCFIDEMVKILLQTIDNEMPVRTILSIGGANTQVGIICLSVKTESFLILCALLKEEKLNYEQELFRFIPELLPRRFTWKMDKNGRFCDVSKELAEIFGSLSSSILGSHFRELANQFHGERYRVLSGY
ncbi:hypothetical protein [Bartonella quintana]|uniref:hypothetical protein n=1 Tax=Bartonella quintana TaxID=803 RepID=UPI00027FCC2A|nr:sensory box histidine kinase [Bartonella quintana RM-11]